MGQTEVGRSPWPKDANHRARTRTAEADCSLGLSKGGCQGLGPDETTGFTGAGHRGENDAWSCAFLV